MKEKKKKTHVESYAINEARGLILKDKAFELSMKGGEILKESYLIGYLIDNATELLDVDNHGLFMKENKDEE